MMLLVMYIDAVDILVSDTSLLYVEKQRIVILKRKDVSIAYYIDRVCTAYIVIVRFNILAHYSLWMVFPASSLIG